MGKVVTFRKGKLPCLDPTLYAQLPEEIQAISYGSNEYSQKLQLVNQLIASCDLSLKDRDIMLTEGRRSQARYIFFTSNPSSIQISPTTRSPSAARSQSSSSA